jgi:hypothetical protein
MKLSQYRTDGIKLGAGALVDVVLDFECILLIQDSIKHNYNLLRKSFGIYS